MEKGERASEKAAAAAAAAAEDGGGDSGKQPHKFRENGNTGLQNRFYFCISRISIPITFCERIKMK